MRVTISTSYKNVSSEAHKANCKAATSILEQFSKSVDSTSDNYSEFFGAEVEEEDLDSLKETVANENKANGHALMLNHN